MNVSLMAACYRRKDGDLVFRANGRRQALIKLNVTAVNHHPHMGLQSAVEEERLPQTVPTITDFVQRFAYRFTWNIQRMRLRKSPQAAK